MTCRQCEGVLLSPTLLGRPPWHALCLGIGGSRARGSRSFRSFPICGPACRRLGGVVSLLSFSPTHPGSAGKSTSWSPSLSRVRQGKGP